jgi:NADH-quinone oxidoreductase subunit J
MTTIDWVQWLAFGILTLISVGGALAVVTDRNIFHSALWLLVSLFGVGGLFVMLSAPFLAAVQVLVYMGAIVILIIFAVMLTRRMMGLTENVNNQWWIGAIVAAITFFVIALVLFQASTGAAPTLAREPLAATMTRDVADLGKALVDPAQYALPFELASVLLTAAMIGAIVIAREDN